MFRVTLLLGSFLLLLGQVLKQVVFENLRAISELAIRYPFCLSSHEIEISELASRYPFCLSSHEIEIYYVIYLLYRISQ